MTEYVHSGGKRVLSRLTEQFEDEMCVKIRICLFIPGEHNSVK